MSSKDGKIDVAKLKEAVRFTEMKPKKKKKILWQISEWRHKLGIKKAKKWNKNGRNKSAKFQEINYFHRKTQKTRRQ